MKKLKVKATVAQGGACDSCGRKVSVLAPSGLCRSCAAGEEPHRRGRRDPWQLALAGGN